MEKKGKIMTKTIKKNKPKNKQKNNPTKQTKNNKQRAV
jgi:hypothetical protein